MIKLTQNPGREAALGGGEKGKLMLAKGLPAF
jgi:hypothetical protein